MYTAEQMEAAKNAMRIANMEMKIADDKNTVLFQQKLNETISMVSALSPGNYSINFQFYNADESIIHSLDCSLIIGTMMLNDFSFYTND